MGGNARESFNQNSQYSGTNYQNQNSQSQSANTSYNTQGSTSYQSGPYSNQAYNNGFNAAYKSNGNGNPGVPYNEHINKKKTDKKSVRYVAALLAAAVLNLAVLGGAFALGRTRLVQRAERRQTKPLYQNSLKPTTDSLAEEAQAEPQAPLQPQEAKTQQR